ncbi:MAG TPA: 3,4-dehydroadipyl-CoA semialdehyde dehydrogenase [Burkholderiales bacterium]|nr:3,4-dehydroadipyl-CoA semialdehyde dehydrogenase [Burkholderiales bacterium]
MQVLQSYVCGRWAGGSGRAQTLVNPATEEPLATASTEGLDLATALEHARGTGGPALRALSFAQRGACLKAMADALQAARDELLEIGIRNCGNTRSDAKFDVDGAIATLLAYAELGTQLGEGRFLVDGEGLQLGRSPRFHGQHVRVPRHGVAVHINAFNFPAWGLAEKAAAALLAGMPVLSKPATATAMLAHRAMQVIVEKQALPEGALQLWVGAPRDLPALLGAQDVLAFTGSGETGERIRALPNIVRHAVRVNVEADSLNAALLGPDAGASGDLYELFLKEMARDITQKAGQKCTAIRRILVPAEHAATVRDDLAGLLGALKVGDPADEEVRMGPLTSAAQRDEVREGIARLAAAGKTALGGVEPPQPRGYFVAPTLIEFAAGADTAAVHEREVFGPVASILACGDDAGALAARGGGGLVCSLYSEDAAWLERTVAEIAPHHGRIYIGHPRIELSPGPGTVLPQLVHGGPGRAGGGEELGGRRALHFYLQRVALQGSRPLVQGLAKGGAPA